MNSVSVRVPASTANLGAGFDCFGMALSLFNTVTLVPADRTSVVIRGEGAHELSSKRDNLGLRTLASFYDQMGKQVPPLRMELDNKIPLARGLGSSAAAIVGVLCAANHLSGDPMSTEQLLRLAAELEGHPDNVAAALLGNLAICVSNTSGNGFRCTTIEVPSALRTVLFVPHFRMPTTKARAVLPVEVSRHDAVYNIGRAALLVAGFTTGRLDILRVATEDRLHQPYRESLFPAAKELIRAALDAGALGVFLSGAGPTILALTDESEAEVVAAFEQTAGQLGTAGKAVVLEICRRGATVLGQNDVGTGA